MTNYRFPLTRTAVVEEIKAKRQHILEGVRNRRRIIARLRLKKLKSNPPLY